MPLAGICVVFICDLVLTCKKRELKLKNLLIKVSYQLIHRRKVHRRIDIFETASPERHRRNVPFRSIVLTIAPLFGFIKLMLLLQ